MEAFSEEETSALVCGKIHALEFQILFTIDGVNFYDCCYWLDHHYVDYKYKELIYATCCTSNIGLLNSGLHLDIVSKVHQCVWNISFPSLVVYHMKHANQNKRYVLSCLDSDGIEKLVMPDVIIREILFGPKGAMSKLNQNDWKKITFIF